MENVVLSGMMNDEECFFDGISSLTGEHFNVEENKEIFNHMQESQHMQSSNILSKKTNDTRKKSAIKILDSYWTNEDDFNVAIQKVKNIFVKRELYHAIKNVSNNFDELKPEEAAEEIYNSVMEVDNEDNSKDIIAPEDAAMDFLRTSYELRDNPDMMTGVPYSVTNNRGMSIGLPSLDEVFHGAQGGDLVMIAGKTGHGKTAFALNLARIFSFYQDYTGYYVNTEMDERELMSRIISPIANVNSNEAMFEKYVGVQSEIEMKRDRVDYAANEYKDKNLYISRISYLPLYKLSGLTRQMKRKLGNLDYLIVDYVGRMEVDDNRNLWDELYRITKGLKQLAVELDIPIFMLAQRNEAGYVEGAKKMRNECDGVLFIEPTDKEDDDHIYSNIRQEHANRVNYKIVKDKVRRNENAYPIYCMFDKAKSFFQEAKRI